ncbi:MAG: hypothetical protein IPH74_16135 [Bacteroidetes bacterium]|nr:hypothetical protein [Bacteroidota bacterium]
MDLEDLTPEMLILFLDQTGNIKLEGNVEYHLTYTNFRKALHLSTWVILEFTVRHFTTIGNFDPKDSREIAVGAGLDFDQTSVILLSV